MESSFSEKEVCLQTENSEPVCPEQYVNLINDYANQGVISREDADGLLSLCAQYETAYPVIEGVANPSGVAISGIRIYISQEEANSKGISDEPFDPDLNFTQVNPIVENCVGYELVNFNFETEGTGIDTNTGSYVLLQPFDLSTEGEVSPADVENMVSVGEVYVLEGQQLNSQILDMCLENNICYVDESQSSMPVEVKLADGRFVIGCPDPSSGSITLSLDMPFEAQTYGFRNEKNENPIVISSGDAERLLGPAAVYLQQGGVIFMLPEGYIPPDWREESCPGCEAKSAASQGVDYRLVVGGAGLVFTLISGIIIYNYLAKTPWYKVKSQLNGMLKKIMSKKRKMVGVPTMTYTLDHDLETPQFGPVPFLTEKHDTFEEKFTMMLENNEGFDYEILREMTQPGQLSKELRQTLYESLIANKNGLLLLSSSPELIKRHLAVAFLDYLRPDEERHCFVLDEKEIEHLKQILVQKGIHNFVEDSGRKYNYSNGESIKIYFCRTITEEKKEKIQVVVE